MLTQKLLKEFINYNHETGELTWLKRDRCHFNSNSSFAMLHSRYFVNKPGFYKQYGHNRYLFIKILAKRYSAHRLAWFYTYGYCPNIIDHINGDGTDNRLINLRDVSVSDNCRNAKLSKSNTSGTTGVHYCKAKRLWLAQIGHNGKQFALGGFEDVDHAISARKSAEKLYNYHPNHGIR